MKTVFICCSFLILSCSVWSQDCFPDGFVFKTQVEVDSFIITNPDCKTFLGNLRIQQSITNLEGFRNLEIINGDLAIYPNGLKDLVGLGNLKKVEGKFGIYSDDSFAPDDFVIKSFQGVESLKEVGELEVFGCKGLRNFIGLENLSLK